MGRAARKLVDPHEAVADVRLRSATSGDVPCDSPARILQDELSARLATSEKADWSPRRTMAFIVLASSAGWSLIAAAVMLAVH